MVRVFTVLSSELERPRLVAPQIYKYLSGTYGVTRDDVGAFLADRYLGLEDYEVDLILSPLFTPTLTDQAVLAEIMGSESIPSDQWGSIVQQLAARPLRGTLVTEDGQAHFIPLREVTIERYVRRLRLDGQIKPDVLAAIVEPTDLEGRSLLKAIARRAVWETESRREILTRFLHGAGSEEKRSLAADTTELLKLVETYQPVDAADLLSRLPHWEQVLRQEISQTTGSKPFFNERVQDLHGGGRDQRRQDNARLEAKEHEMDFLRRLRQRLMS